MTLVDDLQSLPWGIAAKIYGNSHASLIGMFTHWWVSPSPETRWALESGPSFGYHEKGLGGGMCDALLCEDNYVRGVLEVEGTRTKATAEKIGSFFSAELDYYRSISFGILALYAYEPVGKGEARAFRSARDEETVQVLLRVSSAHPEKTIVLVAIDKAYSRQRTGVRARSEYYWGEISKVAAFLFNEGREVASAALYSTRNPP